MRRLTAPCRLPLPPAGPAKEKTTFAAGWKVIVACLCPALNIGR